MVKGTCINWSHVDIGKTVLVTMETPTLPFCAKCSLVTRRDILDVWGAFNVSTLKSSALWDAVCSIYVCCNPKAYQQQLAYQTPLAQQWFMEISRHLLQTFHYTQAHMEIALKMFATELTDNELLNDWLGLRGVGGGRDGEREREHFSDYGCLLIFRCNYTPESRFEVQPYRRRLNS